MRRSRFAGPGMRIRRLRRHELFAMRILNDFEGKPLRVFDGVFYIPHDLGKTGMGALRYYSPRRRWRNGTQGPSKRERLQLSYNVRDIIVLSNQTVLLPHPRPPFEQTEWRQCRVVWSQPNPSRQGSV